MTHFTKPEFNLLALTAEATKHIGILSNIFDNWSPLTLKTQKRWVTMTGNIAATLKKSATTVGMSIDSRNAVSSLHKSYAELIEFVKLVQLNLAMTPSNAKKVSDALQTFMQVKEALSITLQRHAIANGSVCMHSHVELIERHKDYNPHTDEHFYDKFCKVCGCKLN